MPDEPLAISPLWLEYSGLPEHLNARRANAWPVFKKIVELDCQWNAIPDIVEASPAELAVWTGLKAEPVAKILDNLKKGKFVACFVSENLDEKALIQITVPLPTPLTPAAVCAAAYKPFFQNSMRFRYAYPIDQPPGDDERTQHVVDLYFNCIGMRVNAFVLDELRLVARRFTLESIRRAFQKALKNESRDLRAVVRDLVQEAARHE